MLMFIGDVHGDFIRLSHKLANTNVRDSFFIQVGDFGVGFKTKENEAAQLETLNSRLKNANNFMYAIRGNHDDPSYFTNDTSYSNITFLKDYSLLELEGNVILLAGGAISIDRSSRVLNNSYWKEEVFVYKESLLEKAIKDCDHIDIVVTHNAPAEFHPTEISQIVIDWTDKDPHLIPELKKERHKHSLLMNVLIGKKLKPKFWYYGHFHHSFNENFEGVKYRLLNCSEFFEHQ
jgi:UDP-2,3-diacylglucosamine pyrophosphatase LpxH